VHNTWHWVKLQDACPPTQTSLATSEFDLGIIEILMRYRSTDLVQRKIPDSVQRLPGCGHRPYPMQYLRALAVRCPQDAEQVQPRVDYRPVRRTRGGARRSALGQPQIAAPGLDTQAKHGGDTYTQACCTSLTSLASHIARRELESRCDRAREVAATYEAGERTAQ
jgi:hypothetical protein